MKFIIAKGNRKREIYTPFGIAATREDMESLRDQIDTWLDKKPTISMGFIFIQDNVIEMGPPNSQPEPWD